MTLDPIRCAPLSGATGALAVVVLGEFTDR